MRLFRFVRYWFCLLVALPFIVVGLLSAVVFRVSDLVGDGCIIVLNKLRDITEL